ncbi:MAG: NADH-quinone oxidoreductase subunit C [Acidimicrobiales bacterium]
MSDTTTDVETTDGPVDEARQALLEAIASELGDDVVDSHLLPGLDLWVRVTPDAWATTAAYLHDRQRFRFFNYLSAIDWLPSPFGRSMDAEVDKALGLDGGDDDDADDEQQRNGYAGGDTRFQMLARVHNLATGLGVNLKCDVPDDTLTVGTWTNDYPGAEWHEREVWEMFGIQIAGHPGLRKLYLPGDFEGFPLRKDFPLAARLVKPWPGIVDVEPMPEVEEAEAAPAVDAGPSTTNIEAEGGEA